MESTDLKNDGREKDYVNGQRENTILCNLAYVKFVCQISYPLSCGPKDLV